MPLIVHGRTVYLPQTYSVLHSASYWAIGIFITVAAVIDFRKDPFEWRGERT